MGLRNWGHGFLGLNVAPVSRILHAKDKEDFSEKIKQGLKLNGESKSRRIELASKNTWDDRIDKLIHLIDKQIG